jgi:hypothetical protein
LMNLFLYFLRIYVVLKIRVSSVSTAFSYSLVKTNGEICCRTIMCILYCIFYHKMRVLCTFSRTHRTYEYSLF